MTTRPARSALYDWSMAVVSLWLSGGILIDSWYHFHETVESFFEPAHAMLFAGLFASYAFTGAAVLFYRRQGYPFRLALPPGYELTIAGLVLTLAGGILDMIKHSLWGFEQTFDALVSPTHLVIGAGIFLIVTGPISSALLRSKRAGTLVDQLPMILAVASMMELVHWGTQFIFLSNAASMNAAVPPASMPHDTLTLQSIQYYKQGTGLLSVLVQGILLSGFSLYVCRHFRPARGALVTLLVVGNVFVAGAFANYPGQFWSVAAASAAAGLCGEIFLLNPRAGSALRWNAFAFCIPAVYWTVLLSALAATMGGLWWTPDIIVGSVLYAGFTGLFINAIAVKTSVA
jgi:hypothetical protein